MTTDLSRLQLPNAMSPRKVSVLGRLTEVTAIPLKAYAPTVLSMVLRVSCAVVEP